MKFSKKGDGGETSLLGGQRVPKYDPRPETYGTLDEASSALGVARFLDGVGLSFGTKPALRGLVALFLQKRWRVLVDWHAD